MSSVDFLLELYCLIDEQLPYVIPPQGLRQHGPEPVVSDAEVLTMEVAGEFWGHDQDKDLFRFFRQYHRAEFPRLVDVDRSTWVRQAANLWGVAERLRQRLLTLWPADLQAWSLFDSVPIYVSSFGHAPGCRLFAGLAAHGYDHQQKRIFYGFKLHLRSTLEGPIADYQVAPANYADVDLVPELLPTDGGVGVGDRAYWDPVLQEDLQAEGMYLLAPFRQRCSDPYPALAQAISRLRQIIETAISQFAERFNAKWTWARDRWHLCHRIIRKMLAHTACVWLNLQHGNPPLQLERLRD